MDHGERLSIRAIKISADGALGSRGAALLEPYADEPGTSGFLTTPEADLYALTRAAADAGFQTCVHAIGDRANRVVMDTFERVAREVPAARALRNRNEHAQILDAAEIPRFAALGVIASMQPTHATSDMPWVPARIGAARTAEGAYVWQKLRHAGARLASGSDFPVEEPNPLLGFYAAITRQVAGGRAGRGLGAGRAADPRRGAALVHRRRRLRRAPGKAQRLDRGRQARRSHRPLARRHDGAAALTSSTTTVLVTISGGHVTHDALAPAPARPRSR